MMPYSMHRYLFLREGSHRVYQQESYNEPDYALSESSRKSDLPDVLAREAVTSTSSWDLLNKLGNMQPEYLFGKARNLVDGLSKLQEEYPSVRLGIKGLHKVTHANGGVEGYEMIVELVDATNRKRQEFTVQQLVIAQKDGTWDVFTKKFDNLNPGQKFPSTSKTGISAGPGTGQLPKNGAMAALRVSSSGPTVGNFLESGQQELLNFLEERMK